MSASEPTAAVPVDEVKPTVVPPVVEASTEVKAEEPAAVAEDVTPAVEPEATPATGIEASTTEEPPKDETKFAEVSNKSQGFLVKFFQNLRVVGDKKPKAPKSPKDKKKQEEAETHAEETPKEAVEVTEPAKEEAPESAKEIETAPHVVDAPTEEAKAVVKEVVKEEKKALKVGRRLSARVGDLFKSKPKAEVNPPAKVDEHPPKIDEPEPVAPLENPATEGPPEPKAEESANPVDAATPTVAAAA